MNIHTKRFEFSERQAPQMAAFVAELERQGVTYSVTSGCDAWWIELTGGY